MIMTRTDQRLTREWCEDLAENENDGSRIDSRVTCRTVGHLVEDRVGGRCQWSNSSEAVYITAAGRTLRVAAHPSGGVGSQMMGADEPFADVRIGGDHDETSTHTFPTPIDLDDLFATANNIAKLFQENQ